MHARSIKTATMYKILVIEDNDEVRDNMSDILSLAGYEAIGAASGMEGIQMARTKSPDLILCDVMMPDLDGYGVLKILVESEDTATIPFVFVTAKSDQEDMRRGMNLGADDYVTKPFYKDELLRIVEIRLRKRAHRQHKARIPDNWTGFLSKAALDGAMDTLCRAGNLKTYKRGEALFREGEQVRDAFLLCSGHVKLQKTTDFDKTIIVFVFSDGDLFGYPELIANRPYEHDAVALTECEARLVPADKVRACMMSDTNVADMMLGLLACGLLDSDGRMLDLTYVSVRKRCANILLLGHKIFDGKPWPMSREELAQWAGTAKETFIRNLTDFREAGYIDIDQSRVTLTNVKALRELPY